MGVRRAAVLDVGSLSVLLAVGEATPDGPRIVREESRVVRLAEGLRESGRLTDEAIARTLVAVHDLAMIARREGAETIRGAGTAALREATDREVLLRRALDESGIPIEVLDARREAALSLRGVVEGRAGTERIAVIDVGGGSAEIIVAGEDDEAASMSLPLGALRLRETFEETDLAALAEHVRGHLGTLPGGRDAAGLVAVGVGGTITTLGALDLDLVPYDGARLTGHVLSRERLGRLREELAATPLDERRRHPALERGRADVIVHGAVVYESILDHHGWTSIEVSPRGLREGLLAEVLEDAGGDL